MARPEDNYTFPEDKRRWGFGGTEGNITVAPQTVGETPEQGGGGSVYLPKPSGGGENNGGGPGDWTAKKLKEELTALNVEFKGNASKADLLALYEAQSGEQEEGEQGEGE